jgi:5-methylcytosine-specific restriction enzyme subunit McrC
MSSSRIHVHEFDAVIEEYPGIGENEKGVPKNVFSWLVDKALRLNDKNERSWLRIAQKNGRHAVKFLNHVGVIRAPNGFQIEILPKISNSMQGGASRSRALLIEMLRCLHQFKNIRIENAELLATHLPLLEIFIGEFLAAVQLVVKRGIRGDYSCSQDNIFALRGKLQISRHLRENILRKDRFYSVFDEFSVNRPENRLLHAALIRVLSWTNSQDHVKLARELTFIFFDIPASEPPFLDLKKIRIDRGMNYYGDALAWAQLILADESPTAGQGDYKAPSLLFPMESLFEDYVAKHLTRQLFTPYSIKEQARKLSLVKHQGEEWFRLTPDFLVINSSIPQAVLDTKWKLIDCKKSSGSEKYGLSQSDFYQLHAYGQSYLNGEGDLVLIYPSTDNFIKALPVFEFHKSKNLRLWVLPFCLQRKTLVLPESGELNYMFKKNHFP